MLNVGCVMVVDILMVLKSYTVNYRVSGVGKCILFMGSGGYC